MKIHVSGAGLYLAMALTALPASALAGVTISSPTNGTTVTSPATVKAQVDNTTCNGGLNRMQVLVNSTVVYKAPVCSLSTTVTLTSNTNQITVQAIRYDEVLMSQASVTVSLSSSGGTTTATTYSLWGTSAPQGTYSTDNPVELGTRFRASANGTVTGMRFYKGGGTGTHTGSLWDASTGTRLASGTFTNETATGWQTLKFGSPVSIAAGHDYVVSYFTTSGYFYTTSYFANSFSNGPLTAPASSSTTPNGAFVYSSSSTFPTSVWSATNYWVDVLFTAGGTTTSTASPSPSASPNPSPSPTPASSPVTSSTTWPPAFPSGAAHYYVSPNGSDSGSGTQSSPWLTINHASRSIPGGRAVVVHVAPGTYNLNSSSCIYTGVSGGGSSAPIVFVSDQKWGAKINGQGACFYIWQIESSYVSIWGFDITGAQLNPGNVNTGTEVIVAEGGSGYFDISYNRIHDLGQGVATAVGLGPYGGGNYTGAPCSAHDNVFFNLAPSYSTHTFGDYALYIQCGGGNFYNNLVYNTSSVGITSWHSANNLHIYNNTIVNARGAGIVVGTGDGGVVSNAYYDVTNNIVVGCDYGIMAESQSPGSISKSTVFRDNLVYNNKTDWYFNNNGSSSTIQAAGMGFSGNITANPNFTSDYHLTSTSPAIGAATVTGAPKFDLDGVARTPRSNGNIDIGAYEYH